MEIEEDGKSIIEWDGKRGGVARKTENEDFRKTSFQLSRQNSSIMKSQRATNFTLRNVVQDTLNTSHFTLVKFYFMAI